MRRLKTLLLLTLVLAPMVSSLPGQEADESKFEQQPLEVGTSYSLESSIYDGPREVNVWVSPWADPKKPQSVLYVVDGGRLQDFHHISGLAQLASINLDYEELIVVGVKTENRVNELTHAPTDKRYQGQYPDSGGSKRFIEHIRSEVMPFIEKKYNVGERRAIVGESLAGLFIAEVFLKWPDTFTDYICVSPSLWWDDQNLARNAKTLLGTHKKSSRKLYLTMANEGGTMQAGLDKILLQLRNATPEGLEWTYVDRRETETHSTIYHGAVYDALRKLFDVPAPKYSGELPWYLREGARPPAKDETKDE